MRNHPPSALLVPIKKPFRVSPRRPRTAFCLKIARMGRRGWDRSGALPHKAAVSVQCQLRHVAEMGLLRVRPGSRVYAAASLGLALDSSLNQRRVHERAVLHLTKRPNWWFVSASSAAERPYFSIVWRKRKTEAWSGVAAASCSPQKRRSDNRSRTAGWVRRQLFPTSEELGQSADALRLLRRQALSGRSR